MFIGLLSSLLTTQEALGLVRERSTDLRIAEANVQRAEGRWRQALATLRTLGASRRQVLTSVVLESVVPPGLNPVES